MVYWLFFLCPECFVEYQNFIEAKALVTPSHIQPEWYFLSAYAVLRAVPRKLGGVLSLVLFVVVLYFLPFLGKNGANVRLGTEFSCLRKMMFWFWVVNFFLLTWVGSCPVEYPYVFLCQLGRFVYFTYYVVIALMQFIGLNSLVN